MIRPIPLRTGLGGLVLQLARLGVFFASILQISALFLPLGHHLTGRRSVWRKIALTSKQ